MLEDQLKLATLRIPMRRYVLDFQTLIAQEFRVRGITELYFCVRWIGIWYLVVSLFVKAVQPRIVVLEKRLREWLKLVETKFVKRVRKFC